jgi:hypothetical protein
MMVSVEKLVVPFLLTAVLCYFAAAFQIGYFSNVGLEFLSFVGPSDMLFPLGVVALFCLILMLPIQWLIGYVNRIIRDDQHPFRLTLERWERPLRLMPWWWWGLLNLAIAMFALVLWAHGFGWIVHIIWMMFLAIVLVAEVS